MEQSEEIKKLFGKYAEGYQSKHMDVTPFMSGLDIFYRSLRKGDDINVLDVACGPGNNSKYILSQDPDIKLLGIDLSEEMIKLARKNNPEAEFRCMDCKDILRLNRTFDGIVLGFVMPYQDMSSTSKLIQDCFALMGDKGAIYLSAIEGNYKKSAYQGSSTNPEDKLFIHLYEADDLINIMTKTGFTEIKIEKVKDDQSEDIYLIINAIKK